MRPEPNPDDYATPVCYSEAWNEWKAEEQRSPRGLRMPDTREQFVAMAELYDRAYQRQAKENGELRARINRLLQKSERLHEIIRRHRNA